MLKVSSPADLSGRILAAHKAVLLLHTPGCEVSAVAKERLQAIEDRNSSLVVGCADIRAAPGLAKALNVTTTAALVLFRQGKRCATLTGRVTAGQIQQMVDSVPW